MSIKSLGNKKIKLITATAMVIFSLFVSFTGAFAWFLGVNRVDNEAEHFKVNSTSGKFKQITFHPLEEKTIGESYQDSTFSFSKDYIGRITYDWFTKTTTTEGITDVALDNYDYLEHEQPLLMIIELDREYANTEPVVISVKTDDENAAFLGERNASGGHVHELDDSDVIISTSGGVNYYGMSSIVGFYPKEYSSSSFASAFGAMYDEEPTSNLPSQVASALGIDTPTWDAGLNQWIITFNSSESDLNSCNDYSNLAEGISGFSAEITPRAIANQKVERGYESIYSSSTGYVKIVSEYVSASSSKITVSVGLGEPFFEYTNLSSPKSFVTFDNQDHSTFVNEVDPLIKTTGTTKYIAIVLDYYSDAVEYIYSTYLGDTILEQFDNTLHFVCDWCMEVL